MQQAIDVATAASTPYGCVILHRSTGQVITAANTTAQDGKTAHAEMQALRQLPQYDWDPTALVLYTTGEPCPMCMAAIVWCGITSVYYAVSIEEISHYHRQIQITSQAVADQSWLDIEISGGLLRDAAIRLWQ